MKLDTKIFLLFQLTSSLIFSFTDSTSSYFNFTRQDVIGYGEEYETSYYIFAGKKKTPVMILDGGIHGDEIASFIACDSIVKFIKILNGTLIVIPRTNIQACKNNVRSVNFDFNHAFPGNLAAEEYEFRLAYEFMWIVDSVKPDLIINLHEALTKWSQKALIDPEKAYGQIIISCVQPFEDLMQRTITNVNKIIPAGDLQLHSHYYSVRDYSSLDNFVIKFGIKSYTLETWRGFEIDERVKVQILTALQFMSELGIEYEYPEIKFTQ